MKIIVQKYGGSSVADTEKLQQIVSQVTQALNQDTRIAIVVSAMGKTTDGLVSLARSISSHPTRREMDMLLSTGERTTMALLCMAFHEQGIEAVSFTGSQAGIITNDRHNDARVIEVRPFRVMDELEKGRVVVIGGFQGVSYKRDITTLGRGGSDTTAVALAAALDAERCEIYSDIDGVYSADPTIVQDARHIPELSYPVMQEMSTAGAKVLHAQAVQFAKEKNIAIYARSAFDPGRETVIRKMASGVIKGVIGVASESDITLVNICGDPMQSRLQQVLTFLESEQVPIKELHLAQGLEAGNKVSFVVSSKNIYGWERIRKALEDEHGKNIRFDSDLSAVSLIGEGLSKDNSMVLETMDLFNQNGIRFKGMVTTSFRVSVLVDKERINDCIRMCHEKWLN
ncbi:MAG: aspartate kinase [Desulfobacteraceae bacterium]|nr:MAG: aspartate kinase [Desulfobacteraceae bacterium]